MNWLRKFTGFFRSLFAKERLDAEMNEEMRAHVEASIQANVRSGMSPEEARLTALRQFGCADSLQEQCRDQRGMTWLENLVQDTRFGIRQLIKNPGFTLVAVLMLALGIGANTAIFSVINGVLLKPLPYPGQDRLVTLRERDPARGVDEERVSGPNFLDWREQNHVLADMAVTPDWAGSDSFNLVLADSTTKIHGCYASASLFSTLGTPPLLGRTLLPEEDRKEGNRAVVLSHGLWLRQFGGDTNILGRQITLDTYGRRDYTVVGVMPPGFGLPGRNELWLPLGWMGVSLNERRSAHWHNVIARLKPGVTLEQARADLSLIQERIKRAHPGETIGTEVGVLPLVEQAVGKKFQTAVMILWGVVAAVLLIACANVANLLLARAATRQREIALRLALGAGRGRVTRQLLAESLVLSLLGGVFGVLLAWGGLRAFVAATPARIPRLAEVTLDGTALTFTFGVAALTGVLFGLAPAWHASRTALSDALKDGGRGASAGAAASRARGALVALEVALSVVLLTGAGMMIQSFSRMLRAERGFEAAHLLTVELDFSVSGFGGWVRPTADRPQVSLRALMERLRAMPGVQAVGAGSMLLRRENRPMDERYGAAIFGREDGPVESIPRAEFKGVSSDWVRAIGARIVRGRDLAEIDQLEAPGAMVVNESFARRYFPGEDPIGQHLRIAGGRPALNATNRFGQPEWSTIVGVASDVMSIHPQPEAIPEVYVSYWQWPMQSPTLLVRARGDSAALAGMIRRETKATIPNLPEPIVRSMDDRMSESLAQPRLQTTFLALFAGLALLLAVVGLYGVLSYSVAQRQQEIGIRLALGAQNRNIVGLVLGQGMRLTLVGAVLGFFLSYALTRVMRNQLAEIQPARPLLLAGLLALLGIVALLACWLPARRAAKVSPMVALRND